MYECKINVISLFTFLLQIHLYCNGLECVGVSTDKMLTGYLHQGGCILLEVGV